MEEWDVGLSERLQPDVRARMTSFCVEFLRLVVIVRIVRTVQIMIPAGVVSFGCCSYKVSLRF